MSLDKTPYTPVGVNETWEKYNNVKCEFSRKKNIYEVTMGSLTNPVSNILTFTISCISGMLL